MGSLRKTIRSLCDRIEANEILFLFFLFTLFGVVMAFEHKSFYTFFFVYSFAIILIVIFKVTIKFNSWRETRRYKDHIKRNYPLEEWAAQNKDLKSNGTKTYAKGSQIVGLNKMNKYRVLVVDDDNAIVEALKELLETNGHKATCAKEVNETIWLDEWQHQGFHCIITGINQPGMNGVQFTELVRATNGPPVIVISGYKPDAAKKRALAVGAAAFLAKPFELEELLKLVERLVR